jgi:hypothetical protein
MFWEQHLHHGFPAQSVSGGPSTFSEYCISEMEKKKKQLPPKLNM